MKKEPKASGESSRRSFIRSLVASLASAPLVASLVEVEGLGAQRKKGGRSQKKPNRHYKKAGCEAEIVAKTHEPPVIIDDGSFKVILKDTLSSTDTHAPYTYMKSGGDNGDLVSVRVLTEGENFGDVLYYDFLKGTQLWLWFERLKPQSNDCDCNYGNDAGFPDNDPDARILGDPVKIILRDDKLKDREPTHKPNRPNLYTHRGQNWGRHFRIGQWRIVSSSGMVLVGGRGADTYTFHLSFART
ncbi:MAG: hypothetical protein M3362_27015 [Acidobacteriota bacterium]|nr:hypothetical protein [Acidobacteriota bacterium]